MSPHYVRPIGESRMVGQVNQKMGTALSEMQGEQRIILEENNRVATRNPLHW
jgi:hypothetical protein